MYYPEWKYKLSIRCFLEYYYYKILYLHIIFNPSKSCLLHDTYVHKIFSVLNSTIIIIEPFACNNTTFIFFSMKYCFSIRVGLSPSKKDCVICLVESPLKMMKNVFNFVLKAFLVLEIFKSFSSRHYGHVGETA